MTGPLAPTGRLLAAQLAPGSAEWLKRMSASKVAAVVGLSPYESRYSLWMRMAGLVPQEVQTKEMSRGHYLEPGCALWFADQHPDWTISEAGTFEHPSEPWMIATPDRLVTHPNGHTELLQCKTEADREHWGEINTDDIPRGYRKQVTWEMLVTGLRRCHVVVLTSFLEFRPYVVEFDEAEAAQLMAEARQFLGSIAAGARPELDGHEATYDAVRALHPLIRDEKVDVPPSLAALYLDAVVAFKEAEEQKRFASALLADHMGGAQAAYCGGRRIATRRAKNGQTPYVCADRGAVKERAA